MNSKLLMSSLTALMLLSACGDNKSSYSILGSGQTFRQSTDTIVDNKIDMLWVVDNSGSMAPLQTNLTNNFNSFISQFLTKGYDFHMAVTTSDSYLAGAHFQNNSALSKFRDGGNGNHTGVFDILPTTPNLTSVFVTNATEGANGSGDERAFSSMRETLNNPVNSGFLRQGGYLGVIILSDEDDFSDPTRPENSWLFHGGIADHAYNDPNLETVASYAAYLDTLTNSTPTERHYGVSAITVLDNTCLNLHLQQTGSTIIGQRYMDLANLTDGVLGSICDASYANVLSQIQQHIIELGTQFFLNKVPDVSTIKVIVDHVAIAEDAVNGWTYNATANSIVFHGAAIPDAGSAINVTFTPTGLNF